MLDYVNAAFKTVSYVVFMGAPLWIPLAGIHAVVLTLGVRFSQHVWIPLWNTALVSVFLSLAKTALLILIGISAEYYWDEETTFWGWAFFYTFPVGLSSLLFAGLVHLPKKGVLGLRYGVCLAFAIAVIEAILLWIL